MNVVNVNRVQNLVCTAGEKLVCLCVQMLRKANKRKEEDEDFEDKRLNLRSEEASAESKENDKIKDPYYDDV